MRKFNIENRNAGIILLHGAIGEDGTLTVDEVDPSLDKDDVPAILDSIRRDLADGFSGGQLPQRGLEWFELMG